MSLDWLSQVAPLGGGAAVVALVVYLLRVNSVDRKDAIELIDAANRRAREAYDEVTRVRRELQQEIDRIRDDLATERELRLRAEDEAMETRRMLTRALSDGGRHDT